MRAAGLCHSDLSVINGDRPRPMPMVIGHEGAGEVAEVGAEVQAICVRAIMSLLPSYLAVASASRARWAALRCASPASRRTPQACCSSGARRMHRGDAIVNHHLGVSAFAEYVDHGAESLVKVDADLAVR